MSDAATSDCPVCHHPSGVVADLDTLGETGLRCGACDVAVEVEMECDYDNVWCWLVVARPA